MGILSSKWEMPDEQKLRHAIETVGTQWVDLDESNRTVSYRKPGVDINLGGIGKGYAIDFVSSD